MNTKKNNRYETTNHFIIKPSAHTQSYHMNRGVRVPGTVVAVSVAVFILFFFFQLIKPLRV